MTEEYLRILFKRLPFDYVVDYVIMCAKIRIENHINKIADEKMHQMQNGKH